VATIARTYGLTLVEYLGHLGVPRRWVTTTIERDLVIRPLPSVVRALQADTGIAEGVLRQMTFFGLDRDLEEACQRHHAPCPACDREAARRAGRPVTLLHVRAVWRVVCPDHPPYPKPMEVEAEVPLAPFYEQVRMIITFLDRAAFDQTAFADIVGKRLAPAFTAGTFVRFVYLLNGYLSVRVTDFDTMREQAEFRILRAYGKDEDGEPIPLPPDERNDPAISLVLAWQLVTDPIRILLTGLRTVNPARHKTAQDVEQFTTLVRVLLEFWPGEMLTMPLTALTGRALSPREWKGDGIHTALAIAMTDHRRNDPSHAVRLVEAHWNHVAWTGILFSGETVKRHPQRFSQFPAAGPFRYWHVAADTKAAAWIGMARRAAWGQRNWDTRAGLQRFMAKPVRRTGTRHAKPLRLMSGKQAPERVVAAGAHIEEAVRNALAAHEPLSAKLRPRERRALLRKLSAAAIKHLNQKA
jgi:hypothetical protein